MGTFQGAVVGGGWWSPAFAMNCEHFVIDDLHVQDFQVKEALRCLLHSILFQRALGLITPTEVESPLFEGVTYMRCHDVALEKLVEEKVEQVHACLQSLLEAQK